MRSTNPEENITNIVSGDKCGLSTITGNVGISGPLTSDAFSPTFSSTENEEKEICSHLITPGAGGTLNYESNGKNLSNQGLALGATGKRSHPLNRSDSAGSSKGRKFLTPTSSDPQRCLNIDKDRFYSNSHHQRREHILLSASIIGGKKNDTKSNYITQMINNYHQPYQSLLNNNYFDSKTRTLITSSSAVSQLLTNKLLAFNMQQVNVVYEVHDWWQEQVLCSQTTD